MRSLWVAIRAELPSPRTSSRNSYSVAFKRFEVARMRARDEQGDKFDARAFESVENKRKILDDMLDEQVMRLAAERDGIVVSDSEVRAAIQEVPDFQVDGKFNADRYQMLLGSQSQKVLETATSPVMLVRAAPAG